MMSKQPKLFAKLPIITKEENEAIMRPRVNFELVQICRNGLKELLISKVSKCVWVQRFGVNNNLI